MTRHMIIASIITAVVAVFHIAHGLASDKVTRAEFFIIQIGYLVLIGAAVWMWKLGGTS